MSGLSLDGVYSPPTLTPPNFTSGDQKGQDGEGAGVDERICGRPRLNNPFCVRFKVGDSRGEFGRTSRRERGSVCVCRVTEGRSGGVSLDTQDPSSDDPCLGPRWETNGVLEFTISVRKVVESSSPSKIKLESLWS